MSKNRVHEQLQGITAFAGSKKKREWGVLGPIGEGRRSSWKKERGGGRTLGGNVTYGVSRVIVPITLGREQVPDDYIPEGATGRPVKKDNTRRQKTMGEATTSGGGCTQWKKEIRCPRQRRGKEVGFLRSKKNTEEQKRQSRRERAPRAKKKGQRTNGKKKKKERPPCRRR